MKWINIKAKVIYDPYRPGLRKTRPGSLIVADLNYGIGEYYRWLVKKRFGLVLGQTAWTPHVTVLNGRVNLNDTAMKLWKKHQSKFVDIEYSVELEQHWKFWVLPVRSPQLESIREELGLEPKINFHITIGRME